MAIDTASKRASAINPGCPWRGVNVPPDGTIEQADRQAIAFLYGGILATEPAPPPVVYGGGGGGEYFLSIPEKKKKKPKPIEPLKPVDFKPVTKPAILTHRDRLMLSPFSIVVDQLSFDVPPQEFEHRATISTQSRFRFCSTPKLIASDDLEIFQAICLIQQGNR